MKPKKNSYPPVNVGSSFMLVILVILCMVVFAMLSLSGAVRDENYSKKTTDRTTAYYKANNLAEERLEKVDQILFDISKETNLYTSDYQQKTLASLENIEGITVLPNEEVQNALIIQYLVPVGDDDSESLRVTLAANDRDIEGYYRITEWKQISTQEWKGDSSLPLLQ